MQKRLMYLKVSFRFIFDLNYLLFELWREPLQIKHTKNRFTSLKRARCTFARFTYFKKFPSGWNKINFLYLCHCFKYFFELQENWQINLISHLNQRNIILHIFCKNIRWNFQIFEKWCKQILTHLVVSMITLD